MKVKTEGKGPLFLNRDGKKLHLSEIIEHRDIKIVTFSFLTRVKKVPKNGIWGELGFKKTIPTKEKLFKLYDENIMVKADYDNGVVILRFSSKTRYDELKDYDRRVVSKSEGRHFTVTHYPYEFFVPIERIKSINGKILSEEETN